MFHCLFMMVTKQKVQNDKKAEKQNQSFLNEEFLHRNCWHIVTTKLEMWLSQAFELKIGQGRHPIVMFNFKEIDN